MKDTKQIIAENLISLRKKNKLTQLEFAEKFNYSDKTVSKWETGESSPGIDTLCTIANYYNITLDDMVKDNAIDNNKNITRYRTNKLSITLLTILAVWILATILYVYANIVFNVNIWMCFIWAIPASCIMGIIFNAIWGRRLTHFILTSALLWSLLTALYLQFISYNFFIIFVLGIPLQLSIFLWANIRPHQSLKTKKIKTPKTKK